MREGIVNDLGKYPWGSYRFYGYGEEDGLTDRHDIYEAMGRDQSQRQKAYRDYVCCNRDKEEQEIRKNMGKGIMGAEGFREEIEKKVIKIKRRKRGKPRK